MLIVRVILNRTIVKISANLFKEFFFNHSEIRNFNSLIYFQLTFPLINLEKCTISKSL